VSGYAQGVRVEHTVVHHLTDNGYDCQRAASSKGVADVVAFKAGQVLLVSCKRTTMPGPAERAELLRVANLLPGVAVPLVALKPSRKPLEFRRLVTSRVGHYAFAEWHADKAAHEQTDVPDDLGDDSAGAA
jgi:Holliday junction resolvase